MSLIIFSHFSAFSLFLLRKSSIALIIVHLFENLVDHDHPVRVAWHNIVTVHVFDSEPSSLRLPPRDEAVRIGDGIFDRTILLIIRISSDAPAVVTQLASAVLALYRAYGNQKLPVFLLEQEFSVRSERRTFAFKKLSNLTDW